MKKKRLLALALATLTACSLFAGCGDEQGAGKDNTVIKATFGTEPETLDPGKATGVPEATYLGEMFEGLTSLDKDGQPVPAAAEKWDVSEDGLTYTFHLRDSKWSNGDPVTAQDFEFAWKRVLSPELASEYAYMLYPVKGGEEYNKKGGSADAVGVKALDDKTLEVKLARPTAFADYLLSDGTNNYGKYANPQYDALVKKAQLSNDQAERMQAMHEAEKIAIGEMAVLPVYFYNTAVALNPKLKGVIDPGNSVFNFKYAHFE